MKMRMTLFATGFISKSPLSPSPDLHVCSHSPFVFQRKALVLGDLPDKAPKALEPYSRRRHVVLLVDASGSMRNEDVDLDTETSKDCYCASCNARFTHNQPALVLLNKTIS